MNLWKCWLNYTRRRAARKADRDLLMYGNGWVERRWWGYRHISALKIINVEVEQ